jgi:uncharacterized protein
MPDTKTGDRQTALITGASSGIGAEFVRLFAADGYDLVLVARDAERLEALAAEVAQTSHVSCRVVRKDLSSPAAPKEVYTELEQTGVRVDVLVNNAGFGFHGAFSDTDLDRDVQMIQVNLVALTSLTKLFVRGMVARGYGKVLNVGSTASVASTPLMNVYAATKAYVLSFSEALAEELQGSGVTVTVLCPGSTNTRFAERAQMTDTRIFRGRVMNAREVARVGYTALLRGQRVAVVGAANKGMVFSMRFTPRSVVTKIAKRMMAKGPLTARHPTKHEAASR